MQVLPLQDVTVVVNDSHPCENGLSIATPPRDLSLITERQELAERIRGKLLDPNGPENQATEMREEQALREREKDYEKSRRLFA